MAVTHAGANYTTVLDGIAAVGFALVYSLYRSGVHRRAQPSSRYAKDVVCGMQVEKATASAQTTVGLQTFYFCSDHCQSGSCVMASYQQQHH